MINEEEEDSVLMVDKDRKQIREELAHMSFEDLQKLKEKLGSKLYNETIFGKPSGKKTEFKRENKNRPREMSAKKPVSRGLALSLKQMATTKKVESRDPRFDSLCGTFNEKAFKHSYAFINELRGNDVKTLKTELEHTTDQKTVRKIKYLIQRLENQLREENRLKQRKEKKNLERREILQSIKRGEKPAFKKKSEKKILELVSQYEELKNTGKLNKHIQRLRKKNIRKDREKLRMNAAE